MSAKIDDNVQCLCGTLQMHFMWQICTVRLLKFCQICVQILVLIYDQSFFRIQWAYPFSIIFS